MRRKFLASAAALSLIKFTADPDHLSVNTGELVNTFLLTGERRKPPELLKGGSFTSNELPIEAVSLSQKNFCSQSYSRTSDKENICPEGATELICFEIRQRSFFLLYGVCLSQAAMGKIVLAWKHMAHKKHFLWGF